MSKWENFKTYIRSPPPDVIAKVEYRSAFLSALGILTVCSILIFRGFWWVIFALIFQLGSLWANGMAALARYDVFMSLKPEETYEYILDDISFTRRRGRLIKLRHNIILRWLIFPSCFIITLFFTGIKSLSADYILRIKGIPIFLFSDYVLQVAVLTAMLYFIFTYICIGGLIEHIQREKNKEVKDGIQ
jgi:hypothetical protein